MVTDDLIFLCVGQCYAQCLPSSGFVLSQVQLLLKKSARRREQGKKFFCVCAYFLTFQKDIILSQYQDFRVYFA